MNKLKTSNNAINSDSKKQGEARTALFAAGYGKR